ncbi:Putative FAD-binding domain, FAD/NAD(P)-binding domain superfamily [Septoria linicola]|uniref:FAD-binding domain, FAD/NAD(P)-binding domain superfamily n=1 Tax=Septoria linicola TaxID=215465 RepID=A0A9Q9AZ22_9PEZI|nr:putative FAD-binding domain, FAD/NAD(P)-binding domain superfamily [Septoria linicola]USW55823.1 Putative FAD-binding domain, FAD/NAD(P)-binding domain superfamily [Septoria linicola]
MAGFLDNVAIIGAGLGGCALGLALSAQDIPFTIYESRPEISGVIPSGVVLTPNGLRVLDRLGVFERIRSRCYISTHRNVKNDKDETIKCIALGGPEVFGYWNHRIWRGLLLDEMRLMLKERGIAIQYNSRFGGIVSDTIEGVEFRINDQTVQASLLVGSDGIHSTLRKHLAPDVEPEYTGVMGVISHIKWDAVAWPSPDYERNATIQGKPGALFWIAEDPQAEDIMIGFQVQRPEQSRKDLEELQADKDKLVEFYRKGYEEHGATARSIIDAVAANKETLYIWPFMRMPRIAQWYSDSGRMILVGDGAHALPPSSGQGVNQALEDVYSLTLLLASACKRGEAGNPAATNRDGSAKSDLLDVLAFWQRTRQDRIDAIFDWATNTNNVERLPEADRQKLLAEGKVRPGQGDDTSWLFKYDYDKVVNEWLATRREMAS